MRLIVASFAALAMLLWTGSALADESHGDAWEIPQTQQPEIDADTQAAAGNALLVMQMFQAFGMGNVEYMREHLASDVTWQFIGPEELLPFYRTAHGPDETVALLSSLSQSFNDAVFEPTQVIAAGDQVVVIGVEQGTAVATGKPYDETWVCIFRVAGDKVTQVRGWEDSAEIVEAMTP